MLNQLNTLESQSLATIPTISDESALIDYKNTLLGKTGALTVILKGLKDLSQEERGSVGKRANEIRDTLTLSFETQKEIIKRAIIESQLSEEKEDVTTPLLSSHGSIHPITIVEMEVEDTFRRMGFDIHESTQMTTEYLNFDAVNIPKTHPARDMQDTFWLE